MNFGREDATPSEIGRAAICTALIVFGLALLACWGHWACAVDVAEQESTLWDHRLAQFHVEKLRDQNQRLQWAVMRASLERERGRKGAEGIQ